MDENKDEASRTSRRGDEVWRNRRQRLRKWRARGRRGPRDNGQAATPLAEHGRPRGPRVEPASRRPASVVTEPSRGEHVLPSAAAVPRRKNDDQVSDGAAAFYVKLPTKPNRRHRLCALYEKTVAWRTQSRARKDVHPRITRPGGRSGAGPFRSR